MRIAFDVSPLSHPRTGIGNYMRGAIAGLAEVAGGRHELVAFAPVRPRGRALVREALAGVPGLDLRLWPVLPSHAVRTAWTGLGRPRVERLLGPVDALHVTDWWAPPQRRGLRATTIHDLVPLRFPEWVTPRTRAMHEAAAARAPACDLVFVNSAYTGADVAERLGVPTERIRVAHPGIDPVFRLEGPAADLGAPYVLTVATLEPRKNLKALLRAHALLGDDVLLAVAGGVGWGDTPELDGRRVVRLGYVSDEELARLYRGAAASAYPSRFEGFGMPVVEALACGCPTVASAHPSLDEAAGGVALRADPDDPAALADALEQAIARRERTRVDGPRHAAAFTWAACGAAFLGAFEAAA